MKASRSPTGNSGLFSALPRIATMTRSNSPRARRMMSMWPFVMGSKVPAQRAVRLTGLSAGAPRGVGGARAHCPSGRLVGETLAGAPAPARRGGRGCRRGSLPQEVARVISRTVRDGAAGDHARDLLDALRLRE